jgi:hypothetical protein
MSQALWRTRWVWSMFVIVTAVAAPWTLNVAAAQSRTETPAITATCTVTDEFPLPTSPETVPVMVTYMKNSRRPGDDVETKLSKNRLRNGFARTGEFNTIWGPKGIELALIGFRACSYALGARFEPDPQNARADVPKPDVKEAFETVFLRVLHDHNTRTIKRDAREVGFRGLDLYIWWDIAGFPGFAVRPRFGPEQEVSRRGSDEPSSGRPGAVWIDKECVDEGSCPGVLAHEVGHFFGLCHCCHLATEDPRCINGLKPDYCPGLGHRSPQRVSCTTDDTRDRLMSATNPHTDSQRRDLRDCEVQTAQEGLRKVLKFGANGLSTTRGR